MRIVQGSKRQAVPCKIGKNNSPDKINQYVIKPSVALVKKGIEDR
jgi:hypothetical protein